MVRLPCICSAYHQLHRPDARSGQEPRPRHRAPKNLRQRNFQTLPWRVGRSFRAGHATADAIGSVSEHVHHESDWASFGSDGAAVDPGREPVSGEQRWQAWLVAPACEPVGPRSVARLLTRIGSARVLAANGWLPNSENTARDEALPGSGRTRTKPELLGTNTKISLARMLCTTSKARTHRFLFCRPSCESLQNSRRRSPYWTFQFRPKRTCGTYLRHLPAAVDSAPDSPFSPVDRSGLLTGRLRAGGPFACLSQTGTLTVFHGP
jgi:hypothetical protein